MRISVVGGRLQLWDIVTSCSLRPPKLQHQPQIPTIRCANRFQISSASPPWTHKILRSPRKPRQPLSHNPNIRQQARMSAVAVRKGMYHDQTMMPPERDFIGGIRHILHPIVHIAEQNRQPILYLGKRNSKIFFGSAILPRPFPSLLKHLSMQFSHVGIRNHVPRARPVPQRPRPSGQNVIPLPLVEFLFGGKIGNQVRQFVR